MTEDVAKASADSSSRSSGGGTLKKAMVRGSRHEEISDLVVCSVCAASLYVVYVQQRGLVRTVKCSRLAHKSEAQLFFNRLPKSAQVLSLLPKRFYLSRILELPKVEQNELASMVRLEVQANLPPEFGGGEVSYRSITSRRDSHGRYEAYVARSKDVSDQVKSLEGFGVSPDLIVPVSVAWARILDCCQADLLIAAIDGKAFEAAAREADGSIAARTLGAVMGASDDRQLEQAITECVRTQLGSRASDRPLTIGWFADAPLPVASNGRITICLIDQLIDEIDRTDATARGTFLSVACQAIQRGMNQADLQLANLLPRQFTAAKQQRSITRSLRLAALTGLAAMLLLFATLNVLTYRFEKISSDLERKTDSIRGEGEQIARRLQQLDAIRRARATQDDLAITLLGLQAAAPKGVSFNHVELDDAGHLSLHGQAEALSAGVLLPEMLEQQRVFRDVQVGAAGQGNKGEGSIAEFRVECRLQRRTGGTR